MLNEPEFLILDEPVASLDREGREFIAGRVNDFVKSGGGAMVVTHDETLFEGYERLEIRG